MLTDYESNLVRFGPPPLEEDHLKAQHRYYDVGYKTDLSEDWSVSAHYSYLHIEDTQFGVTDIGQQAEVVLQGILNETSRLLAGITGERNKASAEDSTVEGFSPNDHRYSAFMQLDHELTRALTATVGIQYNQQEGRDEDFAPRLGLVYETSPQQGFKLLYNEAFRNPTSSEGDLNLYSLARLSYLPAIQNWNRKQ